MSTIDIKDLQVGSYAQDPNGTVVIIREINPVSIVYETSSEKFATEEVITSIEDLRPIPITQDWLTKLGYDERPFFNHIIYMRNSTSAHVRLRFRNDKFEYSLIIDQSAVELKFVHHLQALVWNLERHWLTLTTAEP